jgi:CRP-like cAMP-binding protein
LSLVQKIDVLRRSRGFRQANVQALVRLALLAREIRLNAGSTLFQRGEAKGLFFLVAEGVVEAVHEAPVLVARFGRGDLVCGYGALGNADNQYVATARSPAVVFSFSEEDFFDVMEEHFELTRSVLAGIASHYTLLSLERERRAAKSAGP